MREPGVIGPFGAAAAAGRLLGFDEDTMARAFGLAGSQAAGTFAAWGTPTVKFHQCRGALSGLMAALLAQQGFLATREFLTTPDGGLYSTYFQTAACVKGGMPQTVQDMLRRDAHIPHHEFRLAKHLCVDALQDEVLFPFGIHVSIQGHEEGSIDIAGSQLTDINNRPPRSELCCNGREIVQCITSCFRICAT